MARPREFDEEEALAKAARVFRRNGYHNSSMQELVAETGVCRASLYETYGDKHALYLKALDHYRKATKEAIEAAARQGTPTEKLRAVYALVVGTFVGQAAREGCFMTSAMLEMLPEHLQTVGPVVSENMATLETVFTTIVREGIATGEFRTDLPVAATVRFLISVVGGLNVLGKVQPDVTALTEVVDVALRSLQA